MMRNDFVPLRHCNAARAHSKDEMTLIQDQVGAKKQKGCAQAGVGWRKRRKHNHTRMLQKEI
jgi:hypothetical protein